MNPRIKNNRDANMKCEFLTETEVSQKLNIPLSTLRYWRCFGGKIRFIKMGRLVRYPIEEVEKYISERLVFSTSEYQNIKEERAQFGDQTLPSKNHN